MYVGNVYFDKSLEDCQVFDSLHYTVSLNSHTQSINFSVLLKSICFHVFVFSCLFSFPNFYYQEPASQPVLFFLVPTSSR